MTLRRGVHPDGQLRPRHHFAGHNHVFQLRQAVFRQHAAVCHLHEARWRHRQLRDALLPQVIHQRFRERQRCRGNHARLGAKQRGRENVDNRIGVEKRRLIAENSVLGELIAFNRLFGVRHKRPLRMRDTLRNARRAACVENRGKVVRRHGLPDLCQHIRVHGRLRRLRPQHAFAPIRANSFRFRTAFFIIDNRRWLQILHDELQALRRQHRVKRRIEAPRRPHAEEYLHAFGAARVHQHCNRRIPRAPAAQRRCNPLRCVPPLPERERCRGIPCQTLRAALCGVLQIVKNASFHRYFSSVSLRIMFAISGYAACHSSRQRCQESYFGSPRWSVKS